jgi:hypothetical protein
MADKDTKRATDPRGDFGHRTKTRTTESHVAPGLGKVLPKAAHGHHPPLASKAPDAAPLSERFKREG